jgi:hypothetical protein
MVHHKPSGLSYVAAYVAARASADARLLTRYPRPAAQELSAADIGYNVSQAEAAVRTWTPSMLANLMIH